MAIPAPRRIWSKIWDQKEQKDERSLGHRDTLWNWRVNKCQRRHLDRSEPLDPAVTHIPNYDWFIFILLPTNHLSMIKIKNIIQSTIILSWLVLLYVTYHILDILHIRFIIHFDFIHYHYYYHITIVCNKNAKAANLRCVAPRRCPRAWKMKYWGVETVVVWIKNNKMQPTNPNAAT